DSLQFASIKDINLIFDVLCDLYSGEEEWINGLRFHCIGRFKICPEKNFIEAFMYYNKALDIFNNDSTYCSINIGQIHYDIALCYLKNTMKDSSKYLKSIHLAIESYMKAIEETVAEIELIDIYGNLSNLYRDIGEYILSIQYKEKQVQFIFKYYSSLDDEKCAVCLDSLAFLYEKIENYNDALFNEEKALKILLESIVDRSSWWIIRICKNLIRIYNEQKHDSYSASKYELIKHEYELKDNK
ncbi:unnamed protein product, partial [Adineta ricciae]